MTETLAATATLIVVAALQFRTERRMALNLNRLNAAISTLEQRATPGDSAGEQAQLDRLATRLEAVAGRFQSAAATTSTTTTAAPAPTTTAAAAPAAPETTEQVAAPAATTEAATTPAASTTAAV